MTTNKTIMTVVVAAFNRSTLTVKCLDSLHKQTLDDNLFEVLVINNNSTDDTETVVSDYIKDKSNFRLITENNQGLSFTRNRGWKEAAGDFVVFIDNDIQADTELLEKTLNSFQNTQPSPVSVGARIMPLYETIPPNWWIDDFEIRTWGDTSRFLNESEAKNGFSGGCCAFQKNTLATYQGFSTSFGMSGGKLRGGEETDLFNRIYADTKNNNQSLWYDPSIKVLHWVPKEHLSFKYHLKRSYGFGISTRENLSNKRHALKYIAGLFVPALTFCTGLLKAAIPSQKKLSTRLVILSKSVAWELGYYWSR